MFHKLSLISVLAFPYLANAHTYVWSVVLTFLLALSWSISDLCTVG